MPLPIVELDDLLARYDLPTVLKWTRIHAGLNDVYRVETAKGPFFLRLTSATWRRRPDVAAEIELLRLLDARGVPVAVPVPARDGAFCLSVPGKEGASSAVLFSEARGKCFPESGDKRARLFGRLAAQMHTAADTIAIASERPFLDLARLIDRPIDGLQEALSRRHRDIDYLAKTGRTLRSLVAELRLDPPIYGLCHGDLHTLNIHFEPDGSATLFDFDMFGHCWRAYDIAVFLWGQTCSTHSPRKLTRRLNAYVGGYEEVRPLGRQERASIPLFLAIRQIWFMGLINELARLDGKAGIDDRFFTGCLTFLKTWLGRHQDIIHSGIH